MKKRLNLNVVLGLTLVTVVIIGVLVWPEPKEAMANELYYVQVFEWENGYLSGLDVKMRFMINAAWSDWYQSIESNAVYKVSRPGEGWTQWEVSVNNNDLIILDDPPGNPAPGSTGYSITLYGWEP